jgi:uncharacterized membrane protein
MKHAWLGMIELFVVLMFGLGWAVLEWVVMRMDRRRREAGSAGSAQGAGHPEGQ